MTRIASRRSTGAYSPGDRRSRIDQDRNPEIRKSPAIAWWRRLLASLLRREYARLRPALANGARALPGSARSAQADRCVGSPFGVEKTNPFLNGESIAR